jgi:WD40 repeat protein
MGAGTIELAVCAVTVDGQELLASAGDDETVRIWDPRSGICVVAVPTHHPVRAVVSVADTLAIGLRLASS